MRVVVVHNKAKHELELDAQATVADLQQLVSEQLGVPPQAQKLVHKGKALSDPDQTLAAARLKDGAKLMLIVKGLSPEEEAQMAAVDALAAKVQAHYDGLGDLRGRHDSIEKGFLERKLALEETPVLHRKVLGHVEKMVQTLEALDALDITKDMADARARRKHLIARIEGYLREGDELAAAYLRLKDNIEANAFPWCSAN